MKKNLTPMKGVVAMAILLFALMTHTSLHADDSWSLNCPPDVTVDCNAELWDLSIYGNAYIYHNYHQYSAGQPVVKYYLNSCGSGYITRTWMAEDPYWNWVNCTQTITVGGGGSFGYYNITWPQDVTVTGCNPDVHPDVTGRPSWDYVQCSMIGVSYKDMLFTVNDGCKKIMRTWTLLDWCGTNGSYSTTFTHKQFIKIVSDEVPTLQCPSDIVVSATDCKKAFVHAEPFVVDPSICGGSFKITNNSPYSITKDGDISGTYPVGTTKVAITVTFGCGQKKTCYVDVTVKNDKPPVAICLQSISIALMGIDTDKDGVNDQGMIDIWAKDLDWKSYSPCGFSPLRFSFSEDSIVMSKTFTCDELGSNEVNIYVWDKHNNTSYCKVNVEVQNNGAKITPCERKDTTTTVQDTSIHSRLAISGTMVDQYSNACNDMNIQLTKVNSGFNIIIRQDTVIASVKDSFINASGALLYFFHNDTTITSIIDTIQGADQDYYSTTDLEGAFSFDSILSIGSTYELHCPEYTVGVKGVDKKDLEALTDFILGATAFDSPAQYIAADLNSDKKIDMRDLSLMINFLRGDINSFDINYEVFLDKELYRESPSSVLNNRETQLLFDSLHQSFEDISFVMVNKGDLTKEQALIEKNDLQIRSVDTWLRSNQESIIAVYPNPFTDHLMVEIEANANGKADVQIYDATGKVVYTEKVSIESGSQSIKITPQIANSGIYQYKILVGEQVFSGRIIKI